MLDSVDMPTRGFMFAVAGTSVVAASLPSLDAGFRHPCRNDGPPTLVYNGERRAWERYKSGIAIVEHNPSLLDYFTVNLSTWTLPYHPLLTLLRCVIAPLRETFFCLSRNAACHSMGEDFFVSRNGATTQR